MPRIATLSPQHYALLQTLQAAPGRAATLVAALPPEAQSWSSAPGAWSAPQVITHLAAADPLFTERLRRLATENNPTVPYFDAAQAAPDDAARPADALVRFAAGRQGLLDMLSGLPPAAWARPGVHARSGPTTLALQVQAIAAHDHEHFAQLTALRAAWDHRPAG